MENENLPKLLQSLLNILMKVRPGRKPGPHLKMMHLFGPLDHENTGDVYHWRHVWGQLSNAFMIQETSSKGISVPPSRHVMDQSLGLRDLTVCVTVFGNRAVSREPAQGRCSDHRRVSCRFLAWFPGSTASYLVSVTLTVGGAMPPSLTPERWEQRGVTRCPGGPAYCPEDVSSESENGL